MKKAKKTMQTFNTDGLPPETNYTPMLTTLE
jgi:hypothetical protein